MSVRDVRHVAAAANANIAALVAAYERDIVGQPPVVEPDKPTRPEPPERVGELPEVRLALRGEGLTFGLLATPLNTERMRTRTSKGLEARTYRTVSAGVCRVVVALANGKGLANLDGLKVEINGETVFDWKGPWCLRPAGELGASAYHREGHKSLTFAAYADRAITYWTERAKEHFRPTPQAIKDKLRERLIEMLKDTKGNIGPYSIGDPWQKDGSTGGADFGIGIASDDAFRCAEGAALLALYFERMFQRSPVFVMDDQGEPEWVSHPQGFSYGFDTPNGYDYSRDEAREWWPEFDKLNEYTKPDNQHGGRLKVPLWLAQSDPYLMWCARHNLNFWELQYRAVPERAAGENMLRWDALDHFGELQGEFYGKPYPGHGRAFAHALNAYLDLDPGGDTTKRMIDMIQLACSSGNIWPHGANILHDNYAAWQTTKNGGPWNPEDFRTMNHELFLLLTVMKRVPELDEIRVRIEDAIRDDLRQGINCETGERFGQVLPYVELYFNDLSKYGGTPQGVFDEAAKRDPLSSANPLLSYPSEFWREAAAAEGAGR